VNENSWITQGIISSCKHKREFYKELQIIYNNNVTLASYYRDYTKILSTVIRKTKIIEHDKLILNYLPANIKENSIRNYKLFIIIMLLLCLIIEITLKYCLRL